MPPRKDIVIIPCWQRPEMLAVCLEQIIKAKHASEHFFLFSLDRNSFPGNLDSIGGFPYLNEVRHRSHGYHGNTFNTIQAYKDAFVLARSHGSRIIYLLEEDILVSRDFFVFHRAAHAKFRPFAVSACANQNLRGRRLQADPRGVYWHHRYQSLGVSFPPHSLPAFTVHGQSAYYSDMIGYLRRRFPRSTIGAQFAEQDGLINRVVENQGLKVLYPFAPRAFHAGWYSYHRPGHAPKGTHGQRINVIRSLFRMKNPARQLGRHAADIKPIPLRGYGPRHLTLHRVV